MFYHFRRNCKIKQTFQNFYALCTFANFLHQTTVHYTSTPSKQTSTKQSTFKFGLFTAKHFSKKAESLIREIEVIYNNAPTKTTAILIILDLIYSWVWL